MKLKIRGDVPGYEEIMILLEKNMPQYSIEKGWGFFDWVNVKHSWLTGVQVAPKPEKGFIHIEGFFGSKWAGFFAGALLMLFTLGKKKRMKEEIVTILRQHYDCLD